MQIKPILVVDDEVEMRIAMTETLKHCGYAVESSSNAIDALKKYKENDYSLVITDMTMPKRSGLELLKDIKRLDSAKPVIMATSYATVETAIEAMKHGAFDYIKKPIDFDSFVYLVERALAFKGNKVSINPLNEIDYEDYDFHEDPFLTQDENILNLLSIIKKLSDINSIVLIKGDTGTGKNLLAKQIHKFSQRSEHAFIECNCIYEDKDNFYKNLVGEIRKEKKSDDLEIFHGEFDKVQGGTLVFDEISELDLKIQPVIKMIIENQQYIRLGNDDLVDLDARFIAITNKNLLELVNNQKFDEGLYFCLNVLPLELPALKERIVDIPLLTDYFLKKYAFIDQHDEPQISPEALQKIKSYHWPGNVRELESTIQRASLICQNNLINPDDLKFL